ncbi:MAG: autotransporter domain-containing protein, partial [bacterium]|nr:autotransporter domain-containing protein [bacterium]
APTWEREIEPEDISVLKGIVGMSMIGGVGSPTQFYFGARLEYALSDNDVSAVNSLVGGTEFDIEQEMDDSLLSLTAGLNHDFGNSWSLEFGLRGDLSDDYNAYTGRMFIRKSF